MKFIVVDHALSTPEEVEQGFMCGMPISADGLSAALEQAQTSLDSKDNPMIETWNEPGSSNKGTLRISSPQMSGPDSPSRDLNASKSHEAASPITHPRPSHLTVNRLLKRSGR